MKKNVACCGLDCSTCDAWKATVNNDIDLRNATAEKWRVMYNAPGLTPEMINCNGCLSEGPRFSHCAECQIRNCAIAKGYKTCADCTDLENCVTIAGIYKYVPEALSNLKNMN